MVVPGLATAGLNLDLLRSLHVGSKARSPGRRRRDLGSYQSFKRLVLNIFSLQISDLCQHMLLCEVAGLLEIGHEPAGHCHGLDNLRDMEHVDCRLIISA